MSIIITKTPVPRSTSADPEDNRLFDEYVQMLDKLSVRANVYEYFIQEMPEDFSDNVSVIGKELGVLYEIKSMESIEFKTLKGNSYSFVHCEDHDLWFVDRKKNRQKNDPIFIFTGKFCEKIFFLNEKSSFTLYFDDEKLHVNDSNYAAIESLERDILRRDANSLISCFADIDIINQHGTCAFNSFFYALMSDDEIRKKFQLASGKMIENGTQSKVPAQVLEAISYFDNSVTFKEKCFKSNFLHALFLEAPDTDKTRSYLHVSEMYPMLKHLTELYAPFIDIREIFDVNNEANDADIFFITDQKNKRVKKILELKNADYELIGIILISPGHAMALSKCQFDPSLWKFHDSNQSENPERYFMFRGTNISFFDAHADYKFCYADMVISPDIAFYKKKRADVRAQDVPSALQKSCEHDFSKMFDQKVNACENTFMQTIFGSVHLRTKLKKSLQAVKNKNALQNAALRAIYWFDNNDWTLCPENIEKLVRSMYLARFSEFKHVNYTKLIPYALQKKYFNLLLDLSQTHKAAPSYIANNGANNLLWDVLGQLIDDVKMAQVKDDRESLYDFEKHLSTQLYAAILLGANPYKGGKSPLEQPIRFCIDYERNKFYQKIFNAFQLLQPVEALKNATKEFHLQDDKNKTLFCNRYSILTLDDIEYKPYRYKEIIGPIIETVEPEKFAALYTVMAKNFFEIFNFTIARDLLYFFQAPFLYSKRGIIVSSFSIKNINKEKNSRDFNSECQQIGGVLLFQDWGESELRVHLVSGYDQHTREHMFLVLMYHAKINNYKKIKTSYTVANNTRIIPTLKNLNFQFQILNAANDEMEFAFLDVSKIIL